MDPDLESLRDVLTDTEDSTPDFAEARIIADRYVAANPHVYAGIQNKDDVTKCVEAVDVLRLAGMEEQHWQMEAWLLHHFNSQSIGGPVQATIRIPEAAAEGGV